MNPVIPSTQDQKIFKVLQTRVPEVWKVVSDLKHGETLELTMKVDQKEELKLNLRRDPGQIRILLFDQKLVGEDLDQVLESMFSVGKIPTSYQTKIIPRAPGYWIFRFIELIFSPEKYNQLSKVRDNWRKEYFEALRKNQGWLKKFFIRFRYIVVLLNMLGVQPLMNFVRSLWK